MLSPSSSGSHADRSGTFMVILDENGGKNGNTGENVGVLCLIATN